MRHELGDNAVILSTRTLEEGRLVEVFAVSEQELSSPAASGGATHDPLLLLHLQHELELLRQQVTTLEYLLRYTTAPTPAWQQLYRILHAEGFCDDFLLRRLPPTSSAPTWKELLAHARAQLTEHLRIGHPPELSDTPLRLLVLGAPGAGKTSTLLKLLLLYKLSHDATVHLIAADIHRLGALEHLQLFASLADIPLTEVYSPQEVRYALSQLPSSTRVVAMDVPGGNPFRSETQRLWQHYCESFAPTALYAVLSSTDSLPVLCRLLQLWHELGVQGLIVTKLDQTMGLGPLLQALEQHPLPVVYLSTGPAIPDDLEPATRENIASRIATAEAA